MAGRSIQDRIQSFNWTMTDALKLTSERIDDVVLLLHVMQRVGLAELLVVF
jgi:hypothetical protein